MHVGSQILELEPFARALDALAGLGEFAEYDLGGGLGIPYRSTDSAPSVAAYAETLTAAVGRQLGEGVRLLVEPGRSLVGNAGITAYRVVSVKRDAVVHVAVDGGMGDNLEPSLYGTEFEARLLCSRERSERCQVVGKHCESGDVLVHDAELPQAQPGDLLVTRPPAPIASRWPTTTTASRARRWCSAGTATRGSSCGGRRSRT